MKLLLVVLHLLGMAVKGTVVPAGAPRLRELLLCTFIVTAIGFVLLLADRNRRPVPV